MAGIVAHAFWCPNRECRALLTMQIIAMPRPEQARVLPASAMPPRRLT